MNFSDPWPDPETVTLDRLRNLTDQAVPMVVFRDFCPAHLSFLVPRDEILNRPAIIVSPTMRDTITEWASTRGLHVEIEPTERTALYRGDAPQLEDGAITEADAVISIRLENVIPGRFLGMRWRIPGASLQHPEQTAMLTEATLRLMSDAVVDSVQEAVAA